MRNISPFAFVIFFLASLACGSVVYGEDASTKLVTILKPINNVSGNFSQKSFDKNEKLLQQQKGHFIVEKSGEFVWYIDPPYEQHIISNGKVINVYDPDLEQLTIKPIDPKTQMIPLLLFGQDGQKIIQQYEVSQRESISSSEVFELRPKQGGNLFSKISIVFSVAGSTYIPVQLEILDSLKQTTKISFEEVALNSPVDKKIFLFSAPEGADVIDERP